ncbi:MAG: hypothetical protein U1A22_00815 [Xanthomonadaceae bacterium]|nr:hypothetical protein [Xanthomonadaceae bacterium]
MLDAALFIVLLFLGLRAFMALRRESGIRREFGQTTALDAFVLVYPVVPLAVLFGSVLLPHPALLVIAGAFFSGAYALAARQTRALDRSGTDRVKGAMSATSSASLGALVGVIYVALSGVFVLISYYIGSTAVGA